MAPRRNGKSPAGRVFGTIVAIVVVVVFTIMQQKGWLPTGSHSTSPSAPGSGTQTPSKPGPSAERPAQTTVASGPTRPLRIGSWNIEWLGKPEDRSGPAEGVAQTTQDLADYIIASDVCILAVQEIIATVNSRPIRSDEIEQTLDLIRRKTGDDWDYILFPGRQDGDQLTGVLWNTAEVRALDTKRSAWDQLDTPWPLPIERGRSAQGSSLWNRPPHAMHFSAGDERSDFVVVVLHMKADYQGDFAAHRADEAAALCRAVPKVVSTFRETDVVILGDTNITNESEVALATIEKSGYRNTNTEARQTHWRGGAMDKVFVPSGQREFAESRFEVMSDVYLRKARMSPQDFKTRLSDHYMVVMTMQVGPDDD